jgi:polyhydroxybutyrate depolymerase
MRLRLRLHLRRLALVLAAAGLGGCTSRSSTYVPPGGDPGNGGSGGAGAGGAGGGGGSSVATCTGKAQPTMTDDTWTVHSGGLDRTAHVHVPPSYDPTRATPLVLNFHGYYSNASQQDLLSRMTAKADREGFIAIHPEGTGTSQSWNAGACCGEAASNNVDDVGFVRDLLATAADRLCIDSHRIFATGMSNGGFLSHRLGCELADRIAAVAPVAGVLGIPTCAPSRPMPIMHFHGTSDSLVPYDGNTMFPSVPSTFAGWGTRDQCTDSPSETFLNGDVHCSSYLKCAGGVAATLCTIDNGGHTWPGGTPIPTLGYTTTYISATDAMWAFFDANPLP